MEGRMRGWMREIDGLLRGNQREGRVSRHLPIAAGLGAVYGVAMALFVVTTRDTGGVLPLLASAVKVPALFFLSVLVTFPSLVVFSALLGVPTRPGDTGRVIVSSITISLAVLASFAPITAFFTLCTTSYPFMKLLSVVFFVVAGAIGIGALTRLLSGLPEEEDHDSDVEVDAESDDPATPAPIGPEVATYRTSSRLLYRIWLGLYVVVGAQMAWVLRPLVGDPEQPFTWFKGRESSFVLDLGETISRLFGG